MATIVDCLGGLVLPSLPAGPARDALAGFRTEFHRCLTARADALFELTDALLCAHGPVTSLVGLSLTVEHRRGHGAMYDAMNNGGVDIARLRAAVNRLPLRNWLRPKPTAAGPGRPPGSTTAAPQPATTSARPPNATSASPHNANAQV